MEVPPQQGYLTSIPGKEFLPLKTDCLCGHCGGPILYRPLTLGIRESIGGIGIDTLGYFCSWPCKRAYAVRNGLLTDDVEGQTTRLMLQFKAHFTEGEDPDGYRLIQLYERFSQIPPAPAAVCWKRFGGRMSDEDYRKSWVQLYKTSTQSINKPTQIMSTNYGIPFTPALSSSSITGPPQPTIFGSGAYATPISQGTGYVPSIIPNDELNIGPELKIQQLSPIFGFCSRQPRGIPRPHFTSYDDQ